MKKNRNYREPEKLVRCPACGAMSYPYRIEGEDLTQEEKDGIYCKSCHINLIPILRRISQEMERVEAERKLKEAEEKARVEAEIQKIKDKEKEIIEAEVTECKE